MSSAVEPIVAAARAAAGDHPPDAVADFARAALRRVPDRELRAADVDAIARAIVDAFGFLDTRRRGQLAIRSLDPDAAIGGTGTPGTVIEVVTEDRPFLLSTVTSELELRGLSVVRSLHPIIGVVRDDHGHITAIEPARHADTRTSYLHLEIDRTVEGAALDELLDRLRRLLQDVLAATGDYERMRQEVAAQVAALRETPQTGFEDGEIDEAAALLEWLLDDNLVLLGTRHYEVINLPGDHPKGPTRAVRVRPGSGLGILADEGRSQLAEPTPLDELHPDVQERFERHELLTISRTNRVSTVHRRVRMEYVGLRRFDDDGRVAGEFRVLGLFTRKGLSEPARTTPVLRRKLERILEREDIVAGSHDEGELIALFQALPKDELFQADLDTLHAILVDLLVAEEQRDIRMMVRTDRFTRTVSVLVAVPRDRYSPALRRRIQDLLAERYEAEGIDVEVSLGQRAEAVVRFSITVAGEVPDVSIAALRREVRRLARSWDDVVAAALRRDHGDATADRLVHEVVGRLPGTYREAVPPERAEVDILALDQLLHGDEDLVVSLHPGDRGALVRLTAVKRGPALELSGFLPILESLGLTVVEEIPFPLDAGPPEVHIHDFGVRDDRGGQVDLEAAAQRLAEATIAAWRGRVEVDSLNRLVLRAGLTWRQVAVLRAYRRYRRQVGTAYTTEYVNEALTTNPDVARALVALFEARFDPERGASDDELAALRRQVDDGCDAVERLDHDRILRDVAELIGATLRTNHFRDDATAQRPDGTQVRYLALKFDPARVPGMVKPVPYREIFVHSPEVEAIHLRGGPVARGGLRWSDRRDDVRTEVLGLMKAQMLKNAVIVPDGAKGGFVVKREVPPGQLRDEVHHQYTTFIRALLDVTDDLTGGDVVPPPQVRRHDGDDPYLVVAADKGTATFSDTANAVAEERGFWLGDAFASGGSQGYDHKALGVTARGAWVAVRRHFRELGVDTQVDPIRVIGIGDMSGDVFGNAMLSSRTLQLVAAFDHRDIFLDPTPDPEAAFAQRERLFRTPGSTWQDYDRDVLSPGGGVWSRAAKRIEISDEIRELLRIDAEVLAPNELIRAILQAPVDLLFAGGIGTFVKASSETHADIGDRANDEIRIDADQLRARVYGEGGNLSITQPARIQYARHGGRINQDAIDNAAGVDISDREVNCKILLRLAVEDGRIDRDERDALLVEVTDDVVARVLRDVDLQTWQLSQELARSPRSMDAYEQLMSSLESRGALDRDVEHLPTTAELEDRAAAGAGLTRPELATLLGYAKRVLTEVTIGSDLPDDPVVEPALAAYFPARLVERFGDLVPGHRLRRELVATIVANDLVDRMGITFAFQLARRTGSPLADVVTGYWAAREVADADRWYREVEATADLLDPDRQLALKVELDRLVGQLTRSYVGDVTTTGPADVIARDRPVFTALRDSLLEAGTDQQRRARRDRFQLLLDDLVDESLATTIATARDLAAVPDVAAVSRRLGGQREPQVIADAFLRIGSAAAVDRLERVLHAVPAADRWARWQQDGLLADLRTCRRQAVTTSFEGSPDADERTATARFLERRQTPIAHAVSLIQEVEAAEEVGLDGIAVATRTLRDALT